MIYNQESLVPYIPASEYEETAEDFLNKYYKDALMNPRVVPIQEIAEDIMHLKVISEYLSEEVDILGATVFTDGEIEVYNPEEMLYERRFFSAKTILYDPEAVKKTNDGCKNNTIAHECVHWWKHRMYHKMQQYVLPRQARYCKCSIKQSVFANEDEEIMETQAVALAPRILMPKAPFTDIAKYLKIESVVNDYGKIVELADFFQVSKQSAIIRLKECSII